MRLRTKLVLLTITGAIITGSCVGLLMGRLISDNLHDEFEIRGTVTAKYLTVAVAGLVIEDNPLAAKALLEEFQQADPGLYYLYVIDLDGEVMAHTFEGGFPRDLLDCDHAVYDSGVAVRYLDMGGENITDVSAYLLEGSEAHVHVGLNHGSIDALIERLRWGVGTITVVTMIVVGLLVFFIANRFMRPLTSLTKSTTDFGATGSYHAPDIDSVDEVGQLASAIDLMASRLEKSMCRSEVLLEELTEERAHLEEQVGERTADLQAVNLELMTANEAKMRFVAAMSHELRTPLNSIIGFTGIMLDGLAGEITDEQEKQLGMVRNSGQHLLALVNDILNLSKIEMGKEELDVSSFSIGEVASHAVGLLHPGAEAKGVIFEVVMQDEDAVLHTDQRAVEQVLVNLVSNALKFTDEGIVRLEVSVTEAGRAVFCVSDTGVGISEEDLGGIFDSFRQAGRPTGEQPQGTGLGLAISSRLAARLGGTIAVASTRGEGSTFTLDIPARLDEVR